MLHLQNIAYTHPDRTPLFDSVSMVVNRGEKIALIGNNGVGKSTLLKVIAGEVRATAGHMESDGEVFFIPQNFGQHDHLTIAEALRIDEKLTALEEILKGHVSDAHYSNLNDDWTIEDRCREALRHWELEGLDMSQNMHELSGGQKTKVFLAGMFIHRPELVLLDEPTNHLDTPGRRLLYDFIQSTSVSMIVVSHDRTLLNLMGTICEMNSHGIRTYGGNYDFYREQKAIENNALHQDIQEKEKKLRKAREKERETMERQQRMDSRGKRKGTKAGMPKTMMNKMKNDAENSTAKAKGVHEGKIEGISEELHELRVSRSGIDTMKFDLDDACLHKGKQLVEARRINFSYGAAPLWEELPELLIRSGERIALKGRNGSGKTTLIKLMLGALEPTSGTIQRAIANSIYIDQDYSLIGTTRTVVEQAEDCNETAMPEHELKIRLNRFLFPKEVWDKPCSALSGGERMRLILCCVSIGRKAPDIIVLDEPTNNLDIQNVEILTSVINGYNGTLIVVSHDELFLQQIHVEREILLHEKNKQS